MLQRRVAPALPHPRAFALSGVQRDSCRIRVSPRLQPAAACGSSDHRTYVRSVWVWLAYGGHYEMGDAYVHVEELPLGACPPTPRVRCTLACGLVPGRRHVVRLDWISQLLRVCSAPGTRVGHEGSFHIPLVRTECYVLPVAEPQPKHRGANLPIKSIST